MTTNAPQTPAYQLPDGQKIGTAADEALQDLSKAQERVGRVMALVTAAAVRDILTDNNHDAPFDATHAELIEAPDGSLHATGRYWTADGTETSFTATLRRSTGDEVFDMNEWVPYLDSDNERVWKPLVEEMPAKDGQRVYRIDLTKAAALPLD
ncbi:hypothetical protein ACFYSJ_05225 [Streptomyces sp. NPDC005248]|uniref:hypothetical protein n=1 Tax=Streptomyces sp. NPDC005248 TaxID=3364709 RepID=UPI0036A7B97B